jgi:Ca2+-binding EF-hand superfamily protein
MIRTLLIFLLSASVASAQTAADRFAEFDKNADGKLTREEFPAAKIFEGADADKDGLLTREEIAAYFRQQQSGALVNREIYATVPVLEAAEQK